ncbi:MAG TPA: SBBP repeat-containing protein [Acidobacteriota bacterium]|jgi:hypothetical protein
MKGWKVSAIVTFLLLMLNRGATQLDAPDLPSGAALHKNDAVLPKSAPGAPDFRYLGDPHAMHFESNAGQAPGRAKLIAHQGSLNLLFETGQIVVLGTGEGFRLTFPNGNAQSRPEGLQPLAAKTHYFLGSDARAWLTDVPSFSVVVYRNVYPGIDLVFHGKDRQLEYDFIVHAGGRPESIRLRFEGLNSRREVPLRRENDGALRIQCGASVFRQHAPRLSQGSGKALVQIPGRYRLVDRNSVGFEIGSYNQAEDLVIDPVLSYSTYLGGSNRDEGRAVAVDVSGNVYVTGYTASLDFLSSAGVRYGSRIGEDVFVLKLSPAGAILYTAYLGGSSDEIAFGIAADNQGNAYITGGTVSPDFPTRNPVQGYRGFEDAFVAKLSPDGSSLVYSTFLGGTNRDQGEAIAVDSDGNAFVTGGTYSADFPTSSAVQKNLSGPTDAFVARLNQSGNQILFSTYLGGSGDELASGIATDAGGNVVVAGSTFSSNFPLQNAIQGAFGGVADAFVSKLSPAGAFLFSTYYGGDSTDYFRAVALDASGNIFATGETSSADFPTTPGSFQPVWRGATDACVVKLNSSGSAVLYSTFLGAGGNDQGFGIGVDSSGNAWIGGITSSIDFPVVSGFQTRYGGGAEDIFIMELNGSGSAPLYSTYWGGDSADYGFALAAGGAGVYVTGLTQSTNDPVLNALQATLRGGGWDALLIKIANPEAPRLRTRRRP